MKIARVCLIFIGMLIFAGFISSCKKSHENHTESGGGVTPPTTPPISPIAGVSTFTLTTEKLGDGTGNLTSTPAGISCGIDCSENYAETSTITITAVATGNSIFSGWSGACSGTGDCVVVMSQAINVKAIFDNQKRTLTLSKAGDGVGKVTSSPEGINCGTDCSESYIKNTSVTLTPTPTDGISTFAGWSGACTGTGNCSVTLDQSRDVVATFQKEKRTLVVTKTGLGNGSVVSSVGAISCGLTCSDSYVLNQSVSLTAAVLDADSLFVGWSGDCSGVGSCVVTMDKMKNVTADFGQLRRELVVSKSGLGTGKVTSSPAGIDCGDDGSDCGESLILNTVIELTPTPASVQSEFTGWSGACSGSGPCSITMDNSKNVTANFGKVMRTLTVSKTGLGTGKVSSLPAGIDCGDGGADCNESLLINTVIALTPTPASVQSEFLSWSGACTGSGPCSVTMDNVKNVTANFGQVMRTLVLTKTGSGSGKVSSAPAGINCGDGGADCNESLLINTLVTLTPTPTNRQSEFTGWSGACSGMEPCQIAMGENKSATANFNLAYRKLTVTKSGSGSGTVNSAQAGISCGSDCSEDYLRDTPINLTQAQGNGYFTGWTGACSGIQGCAVQMSDIKNVNASFDNVSIDGDYCIDGQSYIMCFFIRSNAVVQSAVGTITDTGSAICRSNFYSGNTVSNHSFNITGTGTKISGNFSSAYEILGNFNTGDSSCPFITTQSFNYDATRDIPTSVVKTSGFRGKFNYDPNYK